MKLLLGAAIGYVLGTRAGRERYEAIVRMTRKVAGSQTVQSTAGVLQAQAGSVAHKAREAMAAKLHAGTAASGAAGTNGYHR